MNNFCTIIMLCACKNKKYLQKKHLKIKTPLDFNKLFVLLCSLTTSKMAVFVGCRIESILKDVLLISFATMLGFRTKQTKTDDSME